MKGDTNQIVEEIVILGARGVGKSTLIRSYTPAEFDVGNVMVHLEDENVRHFRLREVSSSDSSLLHKTLIACRGCIVMWKDGDKYSLDDALELLEKINSRAMQADDNDDGKKRILLLVNRFTVEDTALAWSSRVANRCSIMRMSADQLLERARLSVATMLNVDFFECNAAITDSAEQAFKRILFNSKMREKFINRGVPNKSAAIDFARCLSNVINDEDLLFKAKVLLVGDSNVGKTALINRFQSDKWLHLSAVGSADIGSIDFECISSGLRFRLIVWDTAGSEKFRSLTKQYYRSAVGCVLVYDVTNADSLKNLHYWIKDVSFSANIETPISQFPFIVLANKKDLKSLRAVTLQKGLEELSDVGPHIETSIKIKAALSKHSLLSPNWCTERKSRNRR